MEKVAAEKVLGVVEKEVAALEGRVSAADIAGRTGFSLSDAQESLERMMELYQCRVSVREATGDILFIFDRPLRKRGSKTFKENLHQLAQSAWQLFVKVYKASIGVVLIVYTLIFVVALIVIALRLAGDDRDRDHSFLPAMIGSIFRAILYGMLWSRLNQAPYDYAFDNDGMRFKRFKPKDAGNKVAKFIPAVYSFVFGPDRPDYSPLDDAKEAAAYIRKNKGKLTAGHLIALAGWTYPQAEEKLGDYLVRFKGQPELTESGTVIAEYHSLAATPPTKADTAAIEFYHDETEAPYVMNGNTGLQNAIIIAMNIFNFVMAGYVLGNFSGSLALWLGGLPLVFSTTFFAIPLLRIPYVRRKEKQRHRNNIRKKLIGAILNSGDEAVTLANLIRRARISAADEKLAAQLLEKIVIELQGNIELNDEGTALYSFPRLAREFLI